MAANLGLIPASLISSAALARAVLETIVACGGQLYSGLQRPVEASSLVVCSVLKFASFTVACSGQLYSATVQWPAVASFTMACIALACSG